MVCRIKTNRLISKMINSKEFAILNLIVFNIFKDDSPQFERMD